MPLYDYDCTECGRRVEVIHGVHSPGPTHCPNCGGGPVRKAFAPPTVVFKGSGWAKVDRRSSSTGTKRESSDEPSKPKESGPAAPAPASGDSGSTSATKTD